MLVTLFSKYRNWVLLFLFLLEVSMLSFLRHFLNHAISSSIFFISSLTIGIIACYRSIQKNNTSQINNIHQKNQPITIIAISGSILSCFFVYYIIEKYPIHISFSDIIPQIDVLVSRFLDFKFPYKAITEWGYELFPTYLPLTWMPFTISYLFNLDPRWLVLILYCIVSALLLSFIKKTNPVSSSSYLLSILPYAFIIIISLCKPRIIGVSVEMMIAAFYLLLCLSIWSESKLLKVIAILLCSLSRYSLVLWLPLLFLIDFIQLGKKQTVQVYAIIALGVLIIYGPFLWKDSSIFFSSYEYHTKAAIAEWSGNQWQEAGTLPFHLFRGIGFASFFYKYVQGDISEKLKVLQNFHLIASILTTVGLCFLFLNYKNKMDTKFFALGSLKIYLVVFYSFIQIPYDYLFVTSLIISIPVISYYFSLKERLTPFQSQ